jgi:hypothetical protein
LKQEKLSPVFDHALRVKLSFFSNGRDSHLFFFQLSKFGGKEEDPRWNPPLRKVRIPFLKKKKELKFPAARKFEKKFVRLDAMGHVIFGTSFSFADFNEFQCSLHLIVPPSMT